MSTKWLILLFFFVFNVVSSDDDVKLWAVLVAGSNGYYNYRHQADICHAYQILKGHGIPDEQIVVMMYDDVAYSNLNPTKGIIINHLNGSDVYHGVLKDYVGENVTPENFINVLLGNSAALRGRGSGKVLKSGPNDHVFINFADHGMTGAVMFPNDELYATQLIETLEKMHQKKMFGKLVLYVEACESGSMFEDILKNNLSIFATTASSSSESSYACYYDDERVTYLGDVYSVNWMEDSDVEDLNKETLQGQFVIVKNETDTSHVQEFGDLSIGKMSVAEFQGRKQVSSFTTRRTERGNINDAVLSHEVPLEILRKRLQAAKRQNSMDDVRNIQKEIFKLESNRKFLLEKVKSIVKLSVSETQLVKHVWQEKSKLVHFHCYEGVARYFSQNCFQLSKNDYALRYMFVFVNMCEMGVKPRAMRKAMDLTCTHPPVYGIH